MPTIPEMQLMNGIIIIKYSFTKDKEFSQVVMLQSLEWN